MWDIQVHIKHEISNLLLQKLNISFMIFSCRNSVLKIIQGIVLQPFTWF